MAPSSLIPGVPPIPPGGWTGRPRGAALYLDFYGVGTPPEGRPYATEGTATVWLGVDGSTVRVDRRGWPQGAPSLADLTARALDALRAGVGPTLDLVDGQPPDGWHVDATVYGPGPDGSWDPWAPG